MVIKFTWPVWFPVTSRLSSKNRTSLTLPSLTFATWVKFSRLHIATPPLLSCETASSDCSRLMSRLVHHDECCNLNNSRPVLMSQTHAVLLHEDVIARSLFSKTQVTYLGSNILFNNETVSQNVNPCTLSLCSNVATCCLWDNDHIFTFLSNDELASKSPAIEMEVTRSSCW